MGDVDVQARQEPMATEGFYDQVIGAVQQLVDRGSLPRFVSAVCETTPHRAERILFYDHQGQPVAVAQHAADQRRQWLADAVKLVDELATIHEGFRAVLPPHLLSITIGARQVVVRPWVAGETLAAELDAGADAATTLTEAVSLLESLHAATARDRRFTAEDLECFSGDCLMRVRRFGHFIDRRLLDRVETSMNELVGRSMPFAVHHGDYEFSNLLRRQSGGLLLLDWELGARERPPCLDLFHLLVAATMRRNGPLYSKAVEALFVDKSPEFADIAARFDGFGRAIGIDEDLLFRLGALAMLFDAAQYLERLPFLNEEPRWNHYFAMCGVLAWGSG